MQNFTRTKYFTGEEAAVGKFSKCEPFWTYYQTKKCIQNLNINSHDLEEMHKKLSLIATKENEDEILEQIEIDFDCIISAIDIRIELEVIEKETKFKIKDLETSAK